jgi:hypothetical protein
MVALMKRGFKVLFQIDLYVAFNCRRYCAEPVQFCCCCANYNATGRGKLRNKTLQPVDYSATSIKCVAVYRE